MLLILGEGAGSSINSQVEHYYLSAAHSCLFCVCITGRLLNLHAISKSFLINHWIVTLTLKITTSQVYVPLFTEVC
jgi:hypothetical protein